jgi:hypothetical protein
MFYNLYISVPEVLYHYNLLPFLFEHRKQIASFRANSVNLRATVEQDLPIDRSRRDASFGTTPKAN